LATTAELFILCHELGHVLLNQGVRPPVPAKEEEHADLAGLELFLPIAQREFGLRRVAAGAVFAIRIFAGLERLGVRFSDAYSPQAKRVELLTMLLRAQCPSAQYFHEVCTIMVSYQDLMNDVENRLDKTKRVVIPDAERTLIRVLGQLEEVARGRTPQETFIADVTDIAGRVGLSVLALVAPALMQYYVYRRGQSYLAPELRVKMGDALLAAIPKFPPPLKPCFL